MSNPYNLPSELILDVTLGTGGYIPGVSDFTMENFHTALRLAKITRRDGLKITTDCRVWDKVYRNGLIERRGDSSEWYFVGLYLIEINHELDISSPNCFTLVTSSCGKQVGLVTKEHR